MCCNYHPLSSSIIHYSREKKLKGEGNGRFVNGTFTKGAAASRCEGPSQWGGASQSVEVLVALGSCTRGGVGTVTVGSFSREVPYLGMKQAPCPGL